MEFIKKYHLLIIGVSWLITSFFLICIIKSAGDEIITPPNNFYDYATEKFRQDSLTIEALEFNSFKALNEAKHSRQVSDSLIAVIRGFKPNTKKEELKALPVAVKVERLRVYLVE